MSRLIDVSHDIVESLAVWPGDTALSRELLCDMARGDNITLSTLTATVHLGTHVDAPNHYVSDGAGVESWLPERFVGLCQVVDVVAEPGQRYCIHDLKHEIVMPRVLFRTNTALDPSVFPQDFSAPTPKLIEWLSDRDVVLVGVDTPSVDLFSSKDLPTHQACARNDVAILEGLRLQGVPVGNYELIALPLKLVGFDASPVRAVLRTLD